MNLKFTKAEINILNDIAQIQIESYMDIIENNLLKSDELLLTQYSSSLEEAIREAKWKISQYQELKKTPLYLGIMEDTEIATMRHLLFHMEEIYLDIDPYSVRQLWEKFFIIEENRNPIYKLSINYLKLKQNEKAKRRPARSYQITKSN